MQTPGEEPNAPVREWRVRLASGKEFGPASSDELRDWVSQRRVPADALLLRDGWSTWQQAQQVFPELSNASPVIENMQTPEEMALYERGPLNCAKCLAPFGDDVLLDGEPVLCPKCGHRTVPAVRYTAEGQRIVAQNEKLKMAQMGVVVVSALLLFASCGFGMRGQGVALIIIPFGGYAAWSFLDSKRLL